MKQSTTFKRLLSYPLSQPKPMLKGLALLFIAALASAGGPWLVQYFIDEHIAKGDYSRDILISLASGLHRITAYFSDISILPIAAVQHCGDQHNKNDSQTSFRWRHQATLVRV